MNRTVHFVIVAGGILAGWLLPKMTEAEERLPICEVLATDPRPDPVLTEYIAYWECPREYKVATTIACHLESMLDAFWAGEYRVPETVEEFLSSPYMVLRREDLINPYHNRPVEFLTKEQADEILAGPREQQEAHLGDIVFWRGGTGSEAYASFSAIVFGGTFRGDSIYMKNPSCGEAPKRGSTREVYEEERAQGYYSNLTAEEKAVLSICQVLRGGPTADYLEADTRPRRITDWAVYDPFITKLLNPYSGGYVQEVDTPSPGNFMTYFGPPWGFQPICWDGESRIVKPLRAFYDVWRESELLRLELGLEPDEEPFPPGL